MHERAGSRYADPVGCLLEMNPGEEPSRVYGALSVRYWLGAPGASELIACTAYFWEPILVGDLEAFLLDLLQQLRERVARGLSIRYGLEMSGSHPDLDRIEWLGIWQGEPDLLERTRAYEQGWSAHLPPGKRARDLTGPEISRLSRRTRPRKDRDDRTVTT